MKAEDRFELIVDTAAMRVADSPTRLGSNSNEVWAFTDAVFGPCVLRICVQGDRARLITEARIGRALPRAVGYPRVLSYGWTRDETDLSWLLAPRLAGRPLGVAWPDLSGSEQQEAAAQTAVRLQALHHWRPSAALTDRLLSWRRHPDARGIVGATLLPLPMSRLRIVADAAADLPGMDREVVRRAVAWLGDHSALAPSLDSPELVVTHGDLHLDNVWWDGHRVRGLLDLEWARLGPAYLDLARTDDDADQLEFGRLLLLCYPQLAVPELAERLRYLRISYELRQLVTWPPPGERTTAELDDDHPVRRLIMLTNG